MKVITIQITGRVYEQLQELVEIYQEDFPFRVDESDVIAAAISEYYENNM